MGQWDKGASHLKCTAVVAWQLLINTVCVTITMDQHTREEVGGAKAITNYVKPIFLFQNKGSKNYAGVSVLLWFWKSFSDLATVTNGAELIKGSVWLVLFILLDWMCFHFSFSDFAMCFSHISFDFEQVFLCLYTIIVSINVLN